MKRSGSGSSVGVTLEIDVPRRRTASLNISKSENEQCIFSPPGWKLQARSKITLHEHCSSNSNSSVSDSMQPQNLQLYG
jgi:hypothetical protein